MSQEPLNYLVERGNITNYIFRPRRIMNHFEVLENGITCQAVVVLVQLYILLNIVLHRCKKPVRQHEIQTEMTHQRKPVVL